MADDFAVDAVRIALGKAGPEGLTKEELQAETGLGVNDLRTALEEVEPKERDDRLYLDEEGGEEGFVQPPPGSEEEERAEPPTVPEVGDGEGGMLARAQIALDVTYRLEEGKPPDVSAVESARTLVTDLANVWPALDARAKLVGVEVFASKRVWPPTEE